MALFRGITLACSLALSALAAGCASAVNPFESDGAFAMDPSRRCGSSDAPGVPPDPPGLIVRDLGGPFGTGAQCTPANDDGSSPQISLAESFSGGVDYFGQRYRSLWVNTNGNVSFRGPLGVFTPTAFPQSLQPMIAPWWADVDTRGGGSVCSAQRPGLFFATWLDVGYFNAHGDLRNAFQLVLRARPDVGDGAFEAQFRFERCEWTTGDASGGAHGVGGTPAQVGFDAGDGAHFLTVPLSRTPRVREICAGSNVGRRGVYRFLVANGRPTAGDGCDGGTDEPPADAAPPDASLADAPGPDA